ncbi:MAG TPA: hypothetical protein VES73_00120 [Lamprocystis sp. (in: g-proteobacteria)]|nr:hypothetical protein [Lamprocystis sp. (in: g-proteobacteria)]
MSRPWSSVLLPVALVSIIGAGAGPATGAAAFKCRQPDGSVIYQAVACADDSAGEEVPLDPAPGGRGKKARGKADDLTPEGQIKALEAQRRKAQKQQAKAAPDKRKASPRRDGPDRAKCAKHRAESVRWRHKTRQAYRDRDDLEYQQQMLEYNEALVERYCAQAQ